MNGPADYFPLVEGAVFEYRRDGPGGRAAMRLEVLAVSKKGRVSAARCRRTWNWVGEPYELELSAFRIPRQ